MTPAEQTKEKILALETAMLEAHPKMPVLLKEIHDFLRSQPDVITLLDEKEISVIVSGLERHTNTFLIRKEPTKSKSKRVSSYTVDDL